MFYPQISDLLSSSVYYFTGFITKVTESDELPTRHLQVSHYHIYIYIYIYIYLYIYIYICDSVIPADAL